MPPEFRHPEKPARGDAVAVVSPSGRSAALFPAPFELGLQRLRDAERARDLHAAFADPEIKAVVASIGGEDELKVLRELDGERLAANPKPFFGYSDNTNLHLFLWSSGSSRTTGPR